TVNYTYDNLDQVTSVSDGTQVMNFSYLADSQGYPTGMQQSSPSLPLAVTLTYEYGGQAPDGGPSKLNRLPQGGLNPSQSSSLPPEQLPLQAEPAMPPDPAPLPEAHVTLPQPLSTPGPYFENRVAAAGALAPNTNVGGLIITNTTWTLAGTPYIVTSSVTVAVGATLTIEAGVLVQFNQSCGLTINGSLMAVGNASQLISFVGTTAQRGWWSGISFAGTVSVPLTGSTLSYVTVSDGGYYSSVPADIYLSYAKVTISHATIRNSYYTGVYGSTGGLADISNTTLTGNGVGTTGETYAIWFNDGSVNPNLASLIVNGNASNAIAFGSGSLTTRTWKSLGVPYVLTGSQTVPAGATLTVEPGVEAQFQQARGLSVQGTLLANGSVSNPISFVGTTAQRGWWSGISFAGTVSVPLTGSTLSYVTVSD
ncbi:MAG: hypothetical protein Q7U75_13225, partial [Desulfobacterales bacterium]|nr:hypothetical protein [Desulfobacterales bacterium]